MAHSPIRRVVNKISLSRVENLVFFAYLAVMLGALCAHEVWRDEVRALSIVKESASLMDVFYNIANEGHPSLWYVLLYCSFSIIGTSLALKSTSFIVAASSAFIFLKYAPFPLLLRGMFLFGFYPVYEYSAISRNYGIGMLLLFAFCALYPMRRERPWVSVTILVLLGNSSAYGFILSMALFGVLLLELLWCLITSRSSEGARQGSGCTMRGYVAAFGIFFLGTSISALQMLPDRSTVFSNVHSLGVWEISSAALQGIFSHGTFAHNAFGSPWPQFVPLVFLALYVIFRTRPIAVAYLLSGVLGIELLHRLIYSGGALRHQGFVYLLVVSGVWLAFAWEREAIKKLSSGAKRSALFLLFCVFSLQVYMGAKAVYAEVRYDFSSVKRFTADVAGDSSYGDVIFVSEPDFIAETIPYYLPNKIFFPRAGDFGVFASFTNKTKDTFTLTELLDEVESLRSRTSRSVILLLPVNVQEALSLDMKYGRTLLVTPEAIERLQQNATYLGRYESTLGDENFTAFYFG